MSIKKTAAIAMIVAAAGLGAGMTVANAHGKKHFGFGHNHFKKGGVIIIGSPGYSCKHWFYKYKKTGNPFFLNRYYDCLY